MQVECCRAVACDSLGRRKHRPYCHPLRIVPRRDGGEALGSRVVGEHAEFHLAIAPHVGVRREPALVTIEQVVDHEPAIILHQVYHAKLDSEFVRDGAGVVDVLHPRAMPDDVVLVDPVLHVSAHDLAALLLEEEGGDTAVDAAGHGDEEAFHAH